MFSEDFPSSADREEGEQGFPAEPSGSVPLLPHWTDPPTGQVPAAVARHDEDDGSESWTGGPSWREHDHEWEQGGFEPSLLGDDETRVARSKRRQSPSVAPGSSGTWLPQANSISTRPRRSRPRRRPAGPAGAGRRISEGRIRISTATGKTNTPATSRGSAAARHVQRAHDQGGPRETPGSDLIRRRRADSWPRSAPHRSEGSRPVQDRAEAPSPGVTAGSRSAPAHTQEEVPVVTFRWPSPPGSASPRWRSCVSRWGRWRHWSSRRSW